MNKKYLMFSLDDGKTERLAEILGNKTSRKILDTLSEQELSEGEISKKLNIPLNTIGYNIKKLKEVGLIDEKKHFFSLRGKRVPIYSVSNKSIIISPKESKKDKIKESISLIAISGIFTAFILWYSRLKEEIVSEGTLMSVEDVSLQATEMVQSPFSSFSFGIVNWFLLIMWVLILFFVFWTNTKFFRELNKKGK